MDRGDGKIEEKIRKTFLERFEVEPEKRKHKTPQPIQSYWWILLGHLKWGQRVGESNRHRKELETDTDGPRPLVFMLLVHPFPHCTGVSCMTNRIWQKGWDVTFEIRL